MLTRASSGGLIVSGSYPRTLFHGPFNAGQSARARAAVCLAADGSARDILYVVANGIARRAVIAELVARRGAVFGVHVVALRRLPLEIERRARVKGADIAVGVVEDVLIERAIRTAIRTAARSIAPFAVGTGLAAAAAATIAEIEHGGGSRASFADALGNIPVAGDGAHVLLDSWVELDRLRESRVRTTADAQHSAIELLRTRMVLGACSLVVLEDLPLFGPVDHDLIAALIAAAQCPVIATSEYAEQLPNAPAMQAYSLLRSLAEWNEQACDRGSDSLSGVVTRVFGPPSEEYEFKPPMLRVTRLEAAGDTGEVRLAARVIQRHLRAATADRPIRPSDILVVARGSRYRELICEIFAESGIGVDASPARSAADTALGSVLLELLGLATDNIGGTRDRALALTRTPHLDLGMHAADRLERWVITRGYLGLDGWDEFALRRLGTRTTNRVNRLKRAIATARTSLVAATSNEEIARIVRRLAKDLRLVSNAYFARRRVVRHDSDDVLSVSLADSSVREDNQTWEIIERILDDTMPALARAAGASANHTRTAFVAEWLPLFARALTAESPGPEQSGADLVRVAGASAGDGQPAKITIILGLQQKVFPRQPHQNPFLRDSVRDQLAQYGIEMTSSEDTTDRERESFVRAIATATDSLYLSYAATDMDGKSTVASFFIEDLQRTIGTEHQFGIERLAVADVVPDPEDASSRAELLAAIAHGVWHRLPATTAAEAGRAACFAAWNDLLTHTTAVIPVAQGRIAAARPLFDPVFFARSPHGTLELSASQLKLLHHCTFQHFVEKVLSPAGLVAPEYDALAKGSLLHDAMMQWVKLDGWQHSDEALRQLDVWFVARAAMLSPAVRGSALARFNIETDRTHLATFLGGELDALRSPGAAQPAYNELAFGERVAKHGNRDPASLPTTFDLQVNTSVGVRTVKFTGAIDRVDIYHTAGITHGVALDYKTGPTSKFYAESMLDGSDLQLRLYLLALERLWNIQPAGALYVGFGDGTRRGAVSEDAVNHIGHFDPKCVTVMSPEAWHAFVHVETEKLIRPLIERLVTFDIVARPYERNCGFCELDSICRYNSYETVGANA